jgi:hypothetical protein
VRDANRRTGTERPPAGRHAGLFARLILGQQRVAGCKSASSNRSWVALVIEDNLALVNCGGFLRAVGPDRLQLSDGEGNTVRLWLTLQHKANYEYWVGETELPNQPYETLEIRFDQCLTYLGAFRVQPKEPVWMTL